MIDISKGRYWDLPWSLVDGCTPCSPGCEHCWALTMENRFRKCPGCGCTLKRCQGWKAGGHTACCPDCNGDHHSKVNPRPDHFVGKNSPLSIRKPTVFAVWNDLFHEAVPDGFINRAFDVMDQCVRHRFLVLTKRPERMASMWHLWNPTMPHVFAGLSVCNQPEADSKIVEFLKVPGKKFLSIEPMLGAIEVSKYLNFRWRPTAGIMLDEPQFEPRIDAVILGGETGPGARPLHLDWVRSVRDQCSAAGVPFFFKQWGEWAPPSQVPDDVIMPMRDAGAGFDPDSGTPRRFSRKAAGRLLDGRTHDELPWVKA